MTNPCTLRFPAAIMLLVSSLSMTAFSQEPATTTGKTWDTMRRAAGFMMDSVSTRGGFVDRYTADLSERWGEIPARSSMIWVQDPGTITVARLHLDMYKQTGDALFLEYARRSANALILGQQPTGGWHYFIDFDPAGTQEWHEAIAKNAWGWEEFYHLPGNATFDDNTTADATEYLLDLYMTTLEPQYRVPVIEALDFILEAQSDEGGWPQRYPPAPDDAEYASYLTFNDGVTTSNIYLLWKAWHLLGDETYRHAAIRGTQFVMISQLGTPQAGWALQYDHDLQAAGARGFEPKSLSPSTTAENIGHLEHFYKMTGDRRYLRGIPDALDWLDKERLPEGHSDAGHTHAQFVELGTGRPLYAHREGTDIHNGRYWVDYDPHNFPGHYGMLVTINVEALRTEYERVHAMSPDEAKAEWEAGQQTTVSPPVVNAEKAQALIDSLDERGAWVEDRSVPDYTDWKFKPRRTFDGIAIRTYVQNMTTLLNYTQGFEKQ